MKIIRENDSIAPKQILKEKEIDNTDNSDFIALFVYGD